jgi:hypothetical protein
MEEAKNLMLQGPIIKVKYVRLCVYSRGSTCWVYGLHWSVVYPTR